MLIQLVQAEPKISEKRPKLGFYKTGNGEGFGKWVKSVKNG
jgi:hypothetical protein